MIQLLLKTVARYISKEKLQLPYRILSTEDLKTKNAKPYLAYNDNLLPLAALQWSRFYSF